MLDKFIKTCRIVCFSDEDKQKSSVVASFAPFEMRNLWNAEDDDGLQTIIIGWKNVKSIYPQQNILVHEINENVQWTYSESEDAETFKNDLEKFALNSVSKFFKVPYFSYDCIIDGDFMEFARKMVQRSNRIFVYFNGKAMYVFDGLSEFGFNLESLRYCGLMVKDIVTEFMTEFGCIILSMENVLPYVRSVFLKRYISIDNVAWTRFGETISKESFDKLFQKIDVWKHIPFMMSMIPIGGMSNDEIRSCFRQCIKDAVACWLSKRKIFFSGNYENQRLNLERDGGFKFALLGHSAKRTITGRINCTESAFNPQNMPKDSPDRNMLVSRFKGGKIVVLDYVSFETKLAMYMCENKKFIASYCDKDIHAETAKKIFGTKNPTSKQRDSAKKANHALLYGGGEERLESILSDAKNPKVAVELLRGFFKPIIDKSEEIFSEYDRNGYVVNPFGTLVRVTKRWAAFNNYVQSTAADIVADKMLEIKVTLNGMKSQFLFQIFDSFVFDMHPSEMEDIPKIVSVLSKHEGAVFQVEITSGDNLSERRPFQMT